MPMISAPRKADPLSQQFKCNEASMVKLSLKTKSQDPSKQNSMKTKAWGRLLIHDEKVCFALDTHAVALSSAFSFLLFYSLIIM